MKSGRLLSTILLLLGFSIFLPIPGTVVAQSPGNSIWRMKGWVYLDGSGIDPGEMALDIRVRGASGQLLAEYSNSEPTDGPSYVIDIPVGSSGSPNPGDSVRIELAANGRDYAVYSPANGEVEVGSPGEESWQSIFASTDPHRPFAVPFAIVPDGADFSSPNLDVAFNSSREEFLVVCATRVSRNPNVDQLFGQRIAADSGATLGQPFPLSTEFQGARIRNPVVAFDQVADRFLVVWTVHRPDGRYAVYYRLADDRGNPIGSSALLSDSLADLPVAAVHPTPNRPEFFLFLAAGLETGVSEFRIGSDTGGQIGTPVQLADVGTSVTAAYDSRRDQFLVVWSGGKQIFGRRADVSTGHAIGSALVLYSAVTQSEVTGLAAPAIVFNEDRDEFFLCWTSLDADPYNADYVYANPRRSFIAAADLNSTYLDLPRGGWGSIYGISSDTTASSFSSSLELLPPRNEVLFVLNYSPEVSGGYWGSSSGMTRFDADFGSELRRSSISDKAHQNGNPGFHRLALDPESNRILHVFSYPSAYASIVEGLVEENEYETIDDRFDMDSEVAVESPGSDAIAGGQPLEIQWNSAFSLEDNVRLPDSRRLRVDRGDLQLSGLGVGDVVSHATAVLSGELLGSRIQAAELEIEYEVKQVLGDVYVLEGLVRSMNIDPAVRSLLSGAASSQLDLPVGSVVSRVYLRAGGNGGMTFREFLETYHSTLCGGFGQGECHGYQAEIALSTVFPSELFRSPSTGLLTVETSAISRDGLRSGVFEEAIPVGVSSSLTADPNPVYVCDGSGLGETMLSWTVPEGTRVEIRVGSPGGKVLTSKTGSGTARTGKWVRDGMSFFVYDIDREQVLAQVAVEVKPCQVDGATIMADPNPIEVCDGTGLGQTALTWTVPEGTTVEIRIGSPDGKMLTRRTGSGRAVTGKWVRDGMTFFLYDVDRKQSLAQVTVEVNPCHVDEATIMADPNPIEICDGGTVGQTTLSWTAPEATTVEIRVGSPDGKMMTRRTGSGSAATGKWVRDGMTFYLYDVGAQRVLAQVTVEVKPCNVPPATITANPNPIRVCEGTVGQTTLTWNAPGHEHVDIRLTSPSGTLFTGGGETGSSVTGNWVSNGMRFYLVDHATGETLASVTVTHTQAGCNRAPVADAGPNQTVAPLETVALDGSGSHDPDGDTLTFVWTQLDTSTTAAVQLMPNRYVARPTFQAPAQPMTLRFSLRVSDGVRAAISSTTVTVEPPPPAAEPSSQLVFLVDAGLDMTNKGYSNATLEQNSVYNLTGISTVRESSIAISNTNAYQAVTVHLHYFNDQCEEVLSFLLVLKCNSTQIFNPLDFDIPFTSENVGFRVFGGAPPHSILSPISAKEFGSGRFAILASAVGAERDTSISYPPSQTGYADLRFPREAQSMVGICNISSGNTGSYPGVTSRNLSVCNAVPMVFNHLLGANLPPSPEGITSPAVEGFGCSGPSLDWIRASYPLSSIMNFYVSSLYGTMCIQSSKVSQCGVYSAFSLGDRTCGNKRFYPVVTRQLQGVQGQLKSY